jgi:hypothetical protein
MARQRRGQLVWPRGQARFKPAKYVDGYWLPAKHEDKFTEALNWIEESATSALARAVLVARGRREL